MGCLQHKPCRGQGCRPALQGLGQDWGLRPTLNGSPGRWVEDMGGGLRSSCSLQMGHVGVLGSLPHTTPHPEQGCLSSGSLDSILKFPGEQGTCKVHLQVSFPRAGRELPLEATVLPGDMAPQIPASCPETPCKKTNWLLRQQQDYGRGDKDDAGLVFLISV